MSQCFSKTGQMTPVTLLEVGPCYILQKKTKEKEGYDSLQVGYKKIVRKSRIQKSAEGKQYYFIKEERIKPDETLKTGDEINLSAFKEGDLVKITGISKGKGFQGAMKLWNFKGKMASHGTKHEHRTIGSIGSRWPQRVILGKKMPGRMGADRTTVKNLKIIKIESENNLLVVKGAVPGRKGTLLEIRG